MEKFKKNFVRTIPVLAGYIVLGIGFGIVLPYAVMGMLVVYCLRDLHFAQISGWLPAVVSVIVVAVLQVWKKKTLLSIVAGTILYMILI